MTAPPLTLPRRKSDAHKGDFGRVLLIGGSRGMSGSIALSSIAALHAGAGSATAIVPDRCLEVVAGFHPAIMTVPVADDPQGRFALAAVGELIDRLDQATGIGCGPGMTTAPGSIRIVERLLAAADTPRVLDADALNAIAAHRLLEASPPPGPLVLTPHPGELHRLVGVSPKDRRGQIEAATSLAAELEIVIVVKGGPTVVVGEGTSWTCPTGNPSLATAGSGDVLTGVVTGLVGQGLAPWDAARLGVWVHGRAGDIAAQQQGPVGMTAVQILNAIPAAIAESVAPHAEG